MALPLHHLVYQSRATAPATEFDLTALLAQARTWNTNHGLTGLLLYSNSDIMQVLEGSETEVRYIFDRIARDYRHANIIKLADGPITQRHFSQWSMGFKALDPREFARLQGYINPAAPDYLAGATQEKDSSLHEVLTAFVASEEVLF